MGEFIASIFIFLTLLMWITTLLSFISKQFNNEVINSLKKQNILIDKYRNEIKKLFSKIN